MVDNQAYNYTEPVARLLTYGKPEATGPEAWPNYLELGFTAEDIPELIRLAIDTQWINDEEESAASWAPYHAWRALGQLHAEVAAEPLLSLYKNQSHNEWVMEELPDVYSMIGPGALPVLADFIADHSYEEWSRVTAAAAIEKIGKVFPEARATSVEILSKQLEAFHETEDEFNAFLVNSLLKLEAKEAAPVIERAFAAGVIDESIVGEWEDVQEALGLLSPEEIEDLHRRREAEQRAHMEAFDRTIEKAEFWGGGATPSDTYWRQTPRTPAAKKAKHKQKLSKQARKKNRKR